MSQDLCWLNSPLFLFSSRAAGQIPARAALRRVLKGAALAICLLVPTVHAGKPAPQCSEVPVRWTIDNSYGYNLLGDGGSYDGTLFICGSGDVTMNLTRSSRYVTNVLNPLAATNSNSPNWAKSASTFASQPFLNVRSILGDTVDHRGPNNTLPTQDYALTTHFGGTFDGPDGSYHIRWVNTSAPLAATPEHVLPRCGSDPVACSAWVNSPWMTAKVKVAYTAVTKIWEITPDETEVFAGHSGVATLYFVKKNTNVNAGQFELFRFRIVIQAQ